MHKPQFPDLESKDHTTSDISPRPSLHIASILPSHDLILNAYPALRPSYLLLTTSPAHNQRSPLDRSDIHAAWTALDRLESGSDGQEYMMIYNCGQEAGCSRSHKHMQLFARPLDFALFPDRSTDEISKVPYVYDLIRLSPSSSNADIMACICRAYLSCLQRARAVLDVREGEHVPHNVVLVRDWMLVIPRRKARVGGVSANAAGMLGLVWVREEEELAEWRRRGACRVLRELGVAVDGDYDVQKANESGSIPPN